VHSVKSQKDGISIFIATRTSNILLLLLLLLLLLIIIIIIIIIMIIIIKVKNKAIPVTPWKAYTVVRRGGSHIF
jgi:hypothetical protein